MTLILRNAQKGLVGGFNYQYKKTENLLFEIFCFVSSDDSIFQSVVFFKIIHSISDKELIRTRFFKYTYFFIFLSSTFFNFF